MQNLRAPDEPMTVVREPEIADEDESQDESQAMQSHRAPKRSVSNRIVQSGES